MAISEKKRAKITGRGKSHSFLALRHDIIGSDEWASLDSSALKLLIDLGAQFRGSNNGDLCPALLRPRWKSEQKLTRALKILVRDGWLIKTRQGGLGMGPDLYGLTWLPIDASERHDHPGEHVASDKWRNKKAAHPIQRSSTPVTGVQRSAQLTKPNPNRVLPNLVPSAPPHPIRVTFLDLPCFGTISWNGPPTIRLRHEGNPLPDPANMRSSLRKQTLASPCKSEPGYDETS